jgi:hypothetical protein
MHGQHGIARPAAPPPIIEAVRQGAWLRVSAVCPASGKEVSVVGPAHANRALQAMALRRLAQATAR